MYQISSAKLGMSREWKRSKVAIMKRHREEVEGDVEGDVERGVAISKRVHVETVVSQQRVIDALQSHIRQLENQLQSERQLAYQALREQERAFLDWQHNVERGYSGCNGNVPRAIY